MMMQMTSSACALTLIVVLAMLTRSGVAHRDRERRVLREVHVLARQGRNRKTHRLREDDVAHGFKARQPQRQPASH